MREEIYMSEQNCVYKRVLLKLSGEALAEKKIVSNDGKIKEGNR